MGEKKIGKCWSKVEQWHCTLGLYLYGWGGAGGNAPRGMVQGYFWSKNIYTYIYYLSNHLSFIVKA